jgi:hypothetical protein
MVENYKPSEKAAILSAPAKDLGPEFRAGEIGHEIDRYRAILRNPAATAEDRRIAEQRLAEYAEIVEEKEVAATESRIFDIEARLHSDLFYKSKLANHISWFAWDHSDIHGLLHDALEEAARGGGQ